MLSVWKLAAGNQPERYYLEQVAHGREDYYAGEGEAPGLWAGSASAALGVDDQVDDDGLTRLLQARNPIDGGELRRPVSDGAVAGFDLTFRAPKSVSILWGTADPAVTAQAQAGHDRAVTEALGYLEREACRARRGHGGHQQVTGNGFVGAAFRHRTSRASDPLLHTHVVVGNLTCGPDGRWTALDGRLLYRHAKTAGVLYQAVLRAELTERLGVQWGPVEQGCADLAGVPRPVIEHFSQRRAEILEHMRQRGETSSRAAQVAAMDTRRHKQHEQVDQLRENWRARAAEQGLGRSELDAITGRQLQNARAFHPETEALLVAREVTENASTFDRRDVLQAWAALRGQGAQVADLEHLADRLLTGPAVIRISGDGHDARFTTPELLTLERELLDDASQRHDAGVALVARAQVDRVIEARGTLSDEQAALVHGLTGEGSGVQIVRAPAGTGKTFALEAAREAWEQGGHRVFGAALSARAASELQSQAGIDSTTIARLRGDLDRGHALRAGDVLVVDEAGMVGTRDLHALSRHAAETAAKLVLVGDDRQLPEIAAGGAFRAIAARQGALELTEVRRQRHTWDREALQALRDGEIEHWANAYREHGRIVARPIAHSVRCQLVSDWWNATQQPGVDAVMIAHRRADVAELNDRARTLAQAAGQLGKEEVIAGDRAFSAGDRIVCERNDRKTDLVNGARGQVTAVDPERSTLTLRLDDGREVQPSDDYLNGGHLAHGYALTAHKAQGATVDRAFVLGSDELYREWGYTALSSHRDEARFYLVSPGSTERNLPNPEPGPDVITERLVSMLGDSRIQRLATDQLEPATPAEDQERQTLVASMLKLDREKRHAAEEADRVRTRSAVTRDRIELNVTARGELGLFARRDRSELAERINRDQDNLTRDQTEIQNLSGTHDTAVERQLTWLAEHGDRTATLLIAEQHRATERSAIQTDGLRSSLAGRSHDDPGLLERDQLARQHLQDIDRAQAQSRGPADLATPRDGLDLELS